MTYKKSSEIEHEKLTAFKTECSTTQMFRNTKCGLKTYLNWRDITIDELIKNGLSEKTFLEQFPDDEKLRQRYTRKSLMVKLSFMKRFLRFCEIDFTRYDRSHQKLGRYFDDDELFKTHLLSDMRDKKATRKQYRQSMTHFANFMNQKFNRTGEERYMPSELVQEVLDKKYDYLSLRDLLMEFHDYNQRQVKEDGTKRMLKSTSWSHVLRIGKFYRLRAGVRVEFPYHDDADEESAYDLQLGGKIVNKEIMRKLLTVSDTRTQMILMILWESGVNPAVAVQLRVKDFLHQDNGTIRSYLNIENPDSIPHGTIFMTLLKRKKNNKSFLFTISHQSLRLISRYLYLRGEGIASMGLKEEITNESFIITQLGSISNKPLQASSVPYLFRMASRSAGLEFDYLPRDFRNSLRTRFEALENSKVEEHELNAILGHMNVSVHYSRHNIETHYLPRYKTDWLVMFDLDNMKEVHDKFRDEIRDEIEAMYERRLGEMKLEIEELKTQQHIREADEADRKLREEVLSEQEEVEFTNEEKIKLKKLLAKA